MVSSNFDIFGPPPQKCNFTPPCAILANSMFVVDIPDGSPIPWKSTSDKNVVPDWNAWDVKYWNYTFSMAEYHLADSGCVVILQEADNSSKKIMNKCLPKSSVPFLHKSWTCINILPLMRVDFVDQLVNMSFFQLASFLRCDSHFLFKNNYVSNCL